MTSRKDYPIYQVLEEKSTFFCPAKWTELFLYLNHGSSNSCHHPIPHAIPQELLSNPAVLHNTPHKLKMQQLMLDGHRPDECHMCWHIEDSDPDAVSDRILKSQHWKDRIADLKVDTEYVPPFIEVVFDNYCNLTCSYCDSGQSSSWAAKIHKHPLPLTTDHRELYSKIHIAPGTTKQDYLEAWLKWWPTIRDQVQTLKISGGEPLMSKNFWRFVESLGVAPNLAIAINSNFSVDSELVKRFASYAPNFRRVTISASIDATGNIAEYARQGLDYQQFLDNIHYWCSDTSDNCYLKLQSTVNVLNVWGLTDKFALNIHMRQLYPARVLDFYSTIVRAPEFQSISLLPTATKQKLGHQIQTWINANAESLTPVEKVLANKTVSYLMHNPEPMHKFEQRQLELDFVTFLVYYNQTSKLQYQDVYPKEFLEWIETIETMHNTNT
jgi:sulfatase maturation enzyme AslB (radical SAM superfamily)